MNSVKSQQGYTVHSREKGAIRHIVGKTQRGEGLGFNSKYRMLDIPRHP